MELGQLSDRVLRQFGTVPYSGVPADGEPRFRAIYWPSGEMLITGQGREMPPFVLFRQNRIHVSGDGKTWQELDEKTTDGLQVLALLDPRMVVRSAAKLIGEDVVQVDLARLPYMNEGIAEDLGRGFQSVEFTVRDGLIVGMTQEDTLPSEPRVSMHFIAAPDAPPPPLA